MTREEYLDILQNNLHGIPPQEAENIMEYYREYFDDAGVENAEKVMQELGAPEQLAKRAAADAAAENGFAGAAGSASYILPFTFLSKYEYTYHSIDSNRA